MNIRISALREISDPRTQDARDQPHRRHAVDPLDDRLECTLGRMRIKGLITEAEYNIGCRWRTIYHNWLCSIGAPNPFPSAIWGNLAQEPLSDNDTLAPGARSSSLLGDERDELFARSFKLWADVLKKLGPRVFHAVNAVAVYEEPEELGDFKYTAYAAKKGLAALAERFG